MALDLFNFFKSRLTWKFGKCAGSWRLLSGLKISWNCKTLIYDVLKEFCSNENVQNKRKLDMWCNCWRHHKLNYNRIMNKKTYHYKIMYVRELASNHTCIDTSLTSVMFVARRGRLLLHKSFYSKYYSRLCLHSKHIRYCTVRTCPHPIPSLKASLTAW